MQNSMILFTFFVFDRKCPFWANLVQIVNIVSLRWNLIPRLIRICRVQWCSSLFSFLTGNTLFGQIWSKNQTYYFKLKFGGQPNSSLEKLMMLFTFFVFDWKYPFGANLVQKIKIFSLRWNLILRIIRICKTQWWCSLFSFSTGNTIFMQIWSEKSKFSV